MPVYIDDGWHGSCRRIELFKQVFKRPEKALQTSFARIAGKMDW